MQESDFVPISALRHYAYCPRECMLIYSEQIFDENLYTMRGRRIHEKVDIPGEVVKYDVVQERSLSVWSDKLGLIGIVDMVEFQPNGSVYPIEYKSGRQTGSIHHRLQLTAQAMCLEEMFGRDIPRGAIYYYGSRRRMEVAITPELRKQIPEMVAEIRTMLEQGTIPAPAADKRCNGCSLVHSCLPAAIADMKANDQGGVRC